MSYLPASVCSLVNLQCLVANNNRLVSLPEEIGEMTSLMELDVSCNEIAHLPVQMGDLAALRRLHLRRNHLQEVPVELTYLQLTFLDLAGNRLASLPVELRFMVTLCDLQLEENPLTCPPANLCGRGRVHIFKYLEIQVCEIKISEYSAFRNIVLLSVILKFIKLISGHQGRQEARRADRRGVQEELPQDQSAQ